MIQALFVIPALHFTVINNKDTFNLYSDTIAVKVTTVAVQEEGGIKDITAPIEMPYSFREILPFILMIVGAVIILLFIYFLIARAIRRRRARRKNVVVCVPPPDPTR